MISLLIYKMVGNTNKVMYINISSQKFSGQQQVATMTYHSINLCDQCHKRIGKQTQ